MNDGVAFRLALSGRLKTVVIVTQGGGEYALPWAIMHCPFRADQSWK